MGTTDRSDQLRPKLYQSCKFDQWRPNKIWCIQTGTPAFNVSQVNGVLHNVVKTGTLYDG